MRLQYLISFTEGGFGVHIEEKGSRRILYWDTLSALALPEDKEALLFLRKTLARYTRAVETLPFRHIEVPLQDVFECMRVLAKTGRTVYNGSLLSCDWQIAATIEWLGDETGRFAPFLRYKGEEIPLEECEKVFPAWCIWKGKAFPLQLSISWRWAELFLKGPRVLDGIQKKRFLEEGPSIQWLKSEVLPRLLLTDVTGCFANLFPEVCAWEKDLLEVGYVKKSVGNSQYFCPGDKVRGALELLLDVGWEIFLADGRRLYRQTQMQWDFREGSGAVTVGGSASFQEKKMAIRPVLEGLRRGKLWVEIDQASAGLLDRKKGALLDGEWVGETLHLKREEAMLQLVSFLNDSDAMWDEALFEAVRRLEKGGESADILPGEGFCGTLLLHQQKGLAWLDFLYRQGFSALLADEMGLGKTVQVLAFFSRLRTNLPTLIVAPASLLYHWQAEICRFLPKARSAVYFGGDALQLSDVEYVITSYARLRLDEERLIKTEWETIVLDESNAIKTAATQTAQAAYRLKGRFRIALSGTPMENRLAEVASQFHFLMPGLIRNIEADIRKIKPFILRRKKDELDLPEKMEQISWVEMEVDQRELYDAYVQGVKTGLLKKIAADGAAAHRMEILEAILRLRQIVADPRLIGATTRGAKIERLIADIEEALSEKRKVLIYSQFTSMLTLIGKEMRVPFLVLDGSLSPIERIERVNRFSKDPEIPLFLLSLKAGGVGLNLTAADYVLLFDPWWNEAVENQAIDRAHRIGQTKTVIAKRYITPASIEEKMLQVKAEKQKAADALFDSGEMFNWTEEDLLHLLS